MTNQVKANKNTTLFNTDLSINGLTINVVGGEYWQQGNLITTLPNDSHTVIADTTKKKTITVNITNQGWVITEELEGDNTVTIDGLLARVGWMELAPNATQFTNFNKVVCVEV